MLQSLIVKCPHCLIEFHDHPENFYIGSDAEGDWAIAKRTCPACRKIILVLQNGTAPIYGQPRNGTPQFSYLQNITNEKLIRPKAILRAPCPIEVPPEFASDYKEGCSVLSDSAKAAAALGRRCLQNLLREVAKVKPGNLADEIQEVLNSKSLPSDLCDSIDAVRNIGNFAAHPMKSQHTGEIIDVEPGEAEWTLDVLESLFDYYFVAPAKRKLQREALNKKLAEAGKKPMK